MSKPITDMPASILVSVPNWVGDVVMATAALRSIRQRFGSSRIVHLMRPYVGDVLAGTGFADSDVYWPDRKAKSAPRSTVELIRRLRRERFDLAVLLTNSFRSAMVARLAGANRCVGYAREGRGWLLTDRLKPRVGTDGKFSPVPALDYYNDVARHLGCDDVSDRLELATKPTDETAIDARLGAMDSERPLVVLNPGANYGSAKCWPAEYYAEVADTLIRRHGARVVASLSPTERPIAERLAAAAKEPLEIFVDPPLGLGPLKALVRRCQLLITNDTGPRHFAAAFDVPVITVFGSSDPAWTVTRFARERTVMLNLECQPCMERECPLEHHNCMKELPALMVIAQAAEVLAGRTMPASARG
ncbi:MAG: lipopolysaccharide heptosyltransferase II [Planctomycetota bacterium]